MAFKMNYTKGGFPFKKTEGDSPMGFNKDYQKQKELILIRHQQGKILLMQ